MSDKSDAVTDETIDRPEVSNQAETDFESKSVDEIDQYLRKAYGMDNTPVVEAAEDESGADASSQVEKSNEREVITPSSEEAGDETSQEEKPLSLYEKYQKKAVDANRYKQIAENSEKKRMDVERQLEELKSRLETKIEDADTEDVYSPDHLKKIDHFHKQLAETQREIAKLKEERLLEQKARLEREEYDSNMRQIRDLQDKFSEFKTEEPVDVLYDKYKNWEKELGRNNVEKYFKDPKFREQAEKSGLAPPKDIDKLKIISDIYSIYKNGNYPSLRSAFKDSDYYDLIMEERISSKKNEVTKNIASDGVFKKLQQKNSEPKTLGKTGTTGTMTGDFELSNDAMVAWLDQHPDPHRYTASQKATYEKIMRKFNIK